MDINIRCVGYAFMPYRVSRTFWDFKNGTQCVPYVYAGLADVF